MSQKINIVLGNAAVANNGNLGCIALTVSFLHLLNEVLSEKNIAYSVYLCDSYILGVGEDVLDCAGEKIAYNYCDNIYYPKLKQKIKYLVKTIVGRKESIFIQRFFDTKENRRKSLDVFKNANFVFDIGQGDSFADIYGADRFESIDSVHILARRFSKPYYLLPQTIGPFNSKSVLGKAVKSLECADFVMARDKQSIDYIKQIAPNQKEVGEYVDVAFFLPYKRAEFDKKFTHIGLNISGLLWNGGYTGKNELGLSVDYRKLVRNIIDFFLSLPDVKIHIIPHVRSLVRVADNDFCISSDLVKEYANSRLVLADYFKGPVEAKNYISGMNFFMGARMHSTIAAFSSCTPVVPMAYSRKFNGLFADTLHYPYMVDMKSDSEEDILDIIKKTFKDRGNLKKAEEREMSSTVAEAKAKLKSDLSKILKV